eukprot:8011322-Heterocapsa_arctica.AAC.1
MSAGPLSSTWRSVPSLANCMPERRSRRMMRWPCGPQTAKSRYGEPPARRMWFTQESWSTVGSESGGGRTPTPKTAS